MNFEQKTLLGLVYSAALITAITDNECGQWEKNAETIQSNYEPLSDDYGYFRLPAVLLGLMCLSIFLVRRNMWSIKEGKLIRYHFDLLANPKIPEGVTSIGAGAFRGCSSLRSITIPASVTSIGHEAFTGCNSLTSIIIPKGVTSIGYGAFRGCSSLRSITIPASVTSIDRKTFSGCGRLASIIIPEGVTSIGEDAFRGCNSLSSIIIPEGVTSIDTGAFRGCSSLTSITIPASVTSIGGEAFSGCNSLTSIIIPKGVAHIGVGAFAECSSLTSIIIPKGVTSIGPGAFQGCNSLTSITIPANVTSIGGEAFSGCNSLASITIPKGVTSIGYGTFRGCSSLTSIVIPKGVTFIGYDAFRGCNSLTSITIPAGVTFIYDGAFAGCSNLTSITIPSSVSDVGDDVFRDCTPQLLKHVCRFPIVFQKFEMHQHEYQATVHSFVAEKLASLRTLKTDLENNNPHAVFDINDPEEARLCFYIIRNLIRRLDAALLDDLHSLVEIPAVRALLHTRVMTGQSNELLKLAISIGNQEAAQILLSVPAVRDLAAANNFYRDIARGNLDLRDLARNRESSMNALSMAEQRRLQSVSEHYQPRLQAAGVPNVMDELRNVLLDRYHANPAIFTRDNGDEFVLPALWEGPGGFGAMLRSNSFSEQEKQRAKEAYHTHKDHTAWRYLSIPNPWMSTRASNVHVNAFHTKRWAMFDGYEPLITMLYLAARDEDIGCTDGFTVETRLEHFIDELAHIGRAHNWDPAYGDQGAEYDHIHQGDRPSCYSGMKRRLFQSVLGHPLLQILTPEKIEQELHEFVRTHFQSQINIEDKQTLQAIYERAILDATPIAGDTTQLATLNISEEAIASFVNHLKNKYGVQFDGCIEQYTRDRLSLTAAGVTYEHHASKFGAILGDLLNQLSVNESGELASVTQYDGSLFSAAPQQGNTLNEMKIINNAIEAKHNSINPSSGFL